MILTNIYILWKKSINGNHKVLGVGCKVANSSKSISFSLEEEAGLFKEQIHYKMQG
jgi:hypothetical protein